MPVHMFGHMSVPVSIHTSTGMSTYMSIHMSIYTRYGMDPAPPEVWSHFENLPSRCKHVSV